MRKSADIRTIRPESSSSGSDKPKSIFGSGSKKYLPSFMSAKKKTNNIAPSSYE
jgi:hypothetical protein